MIRNIALVLIVITNITLITTLPAFASESFYDAQDLENSMYNHLQNWDENFEFSYDGNDTMDLLKSASENDDYLERSIDKFKILKRNSEYIAEVTYRTTKEQENYIDSELKRIVNNMIDPNMSDIDKVKTINDYIVKIYKYDYSLKSDNVYSALTTGTTICQGYAMTAYKMFKLAGIECRIVVGTINGGPHGWNLVKINGNWYHLDITNNDSIIRDKYLLISDNFLASNGFSWDRTKYPSANYSYYSSSMAYIDYNNDKESDISEYYNGGHWYNQNNSWYFKRNSGENATNWFKDNDNWYYLGRDGKMQIGWIYDKGNWYYCWSNGIMATSTKVNGYTLNEHGAWIA
ncbi:transglutaminase domain-containing protein [Clostridium uliginosum]|nr:transglutaminase-like domain-containing protein [Clostridium uliginosum]